MTRLPQNAFAVDCYYVFLMYILRVLFKARECVRILSRLNLLHFKSLLRYNSDASCAVMRLLGHYLLHDWLERNYQL